MTSVNFHLVHRCHLYFYSLFALLHSNNMPIQLPGSIIVISRKDSIRNFVYKFVEATKCSGASSNDFPQLEITLNLVDPPIVIKRNVGWFFSLQEDAQYDVTEHFENV